nr:hypothetical protein [Tanacetum cinerariifolium]
MYPRFIQLIIQAQVVDLSSHTTRYISPALTQKVFANMRRVGKGCSRIETPLFENMLQVREVDAEEEVQVSAHDDVDQENVTEEIAADVAQPTSPLPPSPVIPPTPPHQSPRTSPLQAAEGSSILVHQVLKKCYALIHRVEGLESANTAQQLEILKLKDRVKKLERLNKDEENVFNQGRKSVDIDEGIELVDDQEKDAHEDLEVQEVVEVVNAAKLITEVATTTVSIPILAAKPVVAAAITPISAVKPKILKSAKDKGKGIFVEDPKPIKKKDQIAMDAEYAQAKDAQATDVQPKDAPTKGIQYIRRYHGYKKKPQSESEAHKNMIAYLKNTEGFKMAFFKGKTYDQIRPIFQARFDANMRFLLKSKEEMEKEEEEIIKSINETPAQKAAKRRRLREQAKEAEDLKKQLEVVADEADDVFVEATLIGIKVPVVNYENMFEKTDVQDVIWRSQQTEHGQALVKSWKLLTSCGVHIITFTTTMFVLLVEKKYPLSRFTLEQLVNMARLQAEEESKMSLELLRFTRQQ